ncbi:MAG: cbb3-type cytochrome oxidase assembly protein CcoS [Azoarcus sp.]|jgi:cbb3-type cytochrome oxidase maturation protein|nr:cbb3-type cytochrome oxidase assembly protein CcoS [Azoarcus sp.]
MEASLYLLIPFSVALVFVIAGLFWWSLRTGQYDDLEGPAYRILFDDRDEASREKENGQTDGKSDRGMP